ncbi:hypothetical protein LNQ03_08585 [Klebsiella pneumoniae subsp. pneumoniae]|nr:hypothetical protein [Klebsiella pneumoniae subsp. pneumoniae]
MTQARKLLMANPAVEDVIQVSGFNILNGTSASNGGFISVMLKDWHQRPPLDAVMADIQRQLLFATGGDDHDLRAADPAGPGQCLGV